jgi:hypothetical protein
MFGNGQDRVAGFLINAAVRDLLEEMHTGEQGLGRVLKK